MEKLILASNSPRRREILRRAGFEFEIKKSEVFENFEVKARPEIMALSFAFEKAFDVAKNNPDCLVLGADTVVALGDEILGKPANGIEEERFLKLLSNNAHRVITGYALILLKEDIKIMNYDETLVEFREISDMEMKSYIESEEPYDKAGGYAIQGEAKRFVKSLRGSFDNVVGLPIEKIKKEFDRIDERRGKGI